MSFEGDLTVLLQTATGAVVHWDTTPEAFVPPDVFIICQQVGGKTAQYVDGAPRKNRNARIQVSVYAKRATARNAVALLVEDAMLGSTLVSEVFGGAIHGFERGIGCYESVQQFGVWYSVP